MIVVFKCDWCQHAISAESGGKAVQCSGCKHWTYTPLDQQPETLKTCSQCGRKVTRFADNEGQRCFICTMPSP